MLAGVVTAVCSLPFDNIKTKMMRMKKQTVQPYNGFIDCFRKSIRNEGVLGLWVGLPTYACRNAPGAMIVVLAQDFLHDLFKKCNY